MHRVTPILNCTIALGLGVMQALAAGPAVNPAIDKAIPSYVQIQKTVVQYFEKIPGYQEGDLITQQQVEPLLKQLEKQGLPLTDAKKILKKVPADDEFLAQQLSTPNGRRFMRRIAAFPDSYDRLDRLSRFPQGHKTVGIFIDEPQGAQVIEYMTTPQGRKKLGRTLSKERGGANFNAPTGRLYTVPLLLDCLERSRAEAVKAAEKK